MLPEEHKRFIAFALNEDLGDGDHSTLASIPPDVLGKAKLIIKEDGIVAGIELAKQIFEYFDSELSIQVFLQDGQKVRKGQVVFEVQGRAQSILSTERLVLNCMQRMSGIATMTRRMVDEIGDCNCEILDTRKTTPGIRFLEKWAVRIGGGSNHRFGLYDMIMLKDNHIDYAGGITNAVHQTSHYLREHKKSLRVEVEVRNEAECIEASSVEGVDRIMLDNFSPDEIRRILPLIPHHIEVEASGGITLENIREYAETGVGFISTGAITHSVKSLDMSLKASIM
jgi:nicotinate-nucleotide pyrophosphorylase (carboxylating)